MIETHEQQICSLEEKIDELTAEIRRKDEELRKHSIFAEAAVTALVYYTIGDDPDMANTAITVLEGAEATASDRQPEPQHCPMCDSVMIVHECEDCRERFIDGRQSLAREAARNDAADKQECTHPENTIGKHLWQTITLCDQSATYCMYCGEPKPAVDRQDRDIRYEAERALLVLAGGAEAVKLELNRPDTYRTRCDVAHKLLHDALTAARQRSEK